LGEGVEIKQAPLSIATPAGVLDYSIDQIKTPWMFSAETDIGFIRDGWLDWYASYAKDEYVGMVGWYWELGPDVDDTRHYISPSATLYNMEMLRILKAGCIANKQLVISYGKKHEKRCPITDTGDVVGNVKSGLWGPFCERRGFYNSYPVRDHSNVFWHDTGSWLFYRAECQWECVRVPGKWVLQRECPECAQPHFTYYGDSEESAYLIHYWAGAVSHNFEVLPQIGGWAVGCQEWWLRREYKLWMSIVPEDIRKESLESGLVPDIEEEIEYALSKIVK
jgi:hypothetical protein